MFPEAFRLPGPFIAAFLPNLRLIRRSRRPDDAPLPTMWPPQDIWDDPMSLAAYYETQAIPIHPQPGILIASILVSILGSYATLLVLGRRTSSKGLRNFALLLLAALSFAAVAVWGMHFVGMSSVRLKASPDVTWYLMFSPGFTVLSLFVPLVATAFAFWFLGSTDDFSWTRSVISGLIVGLTVGLMHYSASFKLPYLNVSYTAVTVTFALVLACVAATVALTLFFRLRSQWQDSFWKRGVCAIFLAAAVCGMHYLGLGGTSYMAKPGVSPQTLAAGSDQSTRLTIAISVMCGCIIVLSLAIAIFDFFIRRDIRNKARHIVVASAAFDSTGKLLVRNDGTIPMQIIQTDADLQRVLGELDPRRSTFQWLYQLSFNWNVITPYVPRILKAITNRVRTKREPPTSDRSVNRAAWEQLLFRSRFVEACVLLAHQLDLSIESLGVMFDRVLTTGTRVGEQIETQPASGDDESSIHGITLRLQSSEGVMLFIVRSIGHGLPAAHDMPHTDKSALASTDSIDHYLSRGYRLTETRFFSKTLADHMGVSKSEMDVFLSACKTYAKRGTRPVVQAGGAYLGLFGIRPTGSQHGGLDVLVYNFARHQIPAYRLPDVGYPLSPAMRGWIRECATLTMGEVLAKCNEAVHAAETDSVSQHSVDETLYEFQAAIAVAIEALTTALRCWPNIQQFARLSPEVLELPTSDTDDKVPAQMILLEVVLPAPEAKITPVQSRASGVQAPGLTSGRHDSDKPPPPFVYTPYNLFTKSQAMLMRAKACGEYQRSAIADLARLYPVSPNDVAAELAAEDKSSPELSANPFENQESRWNSRISKLGRGLIVDTGRGARNPSISGSMGSPGFSDDLEKDVTPSVSALSPTSPHRKGRGSEPFGALLRGPKDSNASDDDLATTAVEMQGPNYGAIRTRTDGWFGRSMDAMQRSDANGLLRGVEWDE
ncbi:hypothetical protein Q5752_003133 [Cryptotrichosporon argae]